MLFTANLEMHHEAVNRIVPGTRTRQVTHTEAALTELIESLDFQALQAQGIEMVGASVDIIGNQVDLELKTNDPTVELSLELAHSGMLDVTVYPVPGEWANVESGEGWRLVTVVQAGGNEAYVVRAATDSAGWTEMWDVIAGGGEPPAVDLDAEVVVSFGHGMGSSCPELRLDGVVIGDGVVFSRDLRSTLAESVHRRPRGCRGLRRGAVPRRPARRPIHPAPVRPVRPRRGARGRAPLSRGPWTACGQFVIGLRKSGITSLVPGPSRSDTLVVPKGQATSVHKASVMSSGGGNGGFGRRVRAEWWLRSSHRARVPSGHFVRPRARGVWSSAHNTRASRSQRFRWASFTLELRPPPAPEPANATQLNG